MPLMRTHVWLFVCLLVLLGLTAPANADIPAWLPRYQLDIQLEIDQHLALVHQRVTWTNRHACETNKLIFNVHSHFKLPDKDVGITAKMVEILRMMPSEAMDLDGHACEIRKVVFVEMAKVADSKSPQPDSDALLPPPRILLNEKTELNFQYQASSDTTLEVALPRAVKQGESVTVDLEFVMRLPNKQGRWGQWEGVTFLSNWLPVLAVYDDNGWQPVPYIPWHQPFFNESGIYQARITLPWEQKLACSGTVQSEEDLGNGLKRVQVFAPGARDFAVLCSARYVEFTGEAGPVHVRCLAFPEHEFYAKFMVQCVCEAIPIYNRWFGAYPYPEFKIVESFFGWNGNECSGLVMIDHRIFSMPHAAKSFVDYLVSHETCHQWWYNVVGTNGYCETWMDEGLATYFSNRLMNDKHGRNNKLVAFPRFLEWLPNVNRDDYRNFGLYGTIGRGEQGPTVQPIDKYGHIVNLFSMCYDRGNKIVGMLEDRLGEAAFFDFMRRIYARYQYRILRVADFQRELEEYTGQSWKEFFDKWLYSAGMADWCVEKVKIDNHGHFISKASAYHNRLHNCLAPAPHAKRPCKATVIVRQKAEITDPTVVGFAFDNCDSFQLRIPLVPQVPILNLEELGARVEALPENRFRIEIELPDRPTQIAVDPDQVLVDCDPSNNVWIPHVRVRFSPLYTFIDETDLTNSYDRWNIIAGPWMYSPTYDNPWFTRDTMFGGRVGAYRTQEFEGGAYAAYRTNYRDIVIGVDGILQHWPWCSTEVGFIAERRLAGAFRGEEGGNRGVVYGRYIIDYGDSLYLPPFHYFEVFTAVTDDLLPFARETVPGGERYRHQANSGAHYHINYLTPYWDAEGGFQFDISYAGGVEVPGIHGANARGSHQMVSQLSYLQSMPDGLGWLSETRLAFRIYGATGLPARTMYFPMGSSELFRGFDIAQRQGSVVWIGSAEWRFPLAQHLNWNFCDRAIGLRNIYGAAFCDVGDTYLRGQSVGGMATALGAGLRLDVSWFTFVERTILRFDTAKAVNTNTPWQYWIALEHPF